MGNYNLDITTDNFKNLIRCDEIFPTVLVFKTSVTSAREAELISSALNKILKCTKWNFDLQDCDHIFRIENCPLTHSRLFCYLSNTVSDAKSLIIPLKKNSNDTKRNIFTANSTSS